MSRSLVEYKGYLGAIRFDAEESVLRGRVVNIDDIVTFQGETVDEVIAEFRNRSTTTSSNRPTRPGARRPFSGRRLADAARDASRLPDHARPTASSLNGQIATVLDRQAIGTR